MQAVPGVEAAGFLVTVPVGLLLAAPVAGAVPAYRAARADPKVALCCA
ncbi:MAG: hypothetical protein ABJC89_18435 [Acidobacteriota bacterium]